MPALHTEFYTSVFSSATALFDDTSVRDAFRSNLHNSNIVYAHALKRLAKEKSGEALADDEFWIACGTNSPQRTVHFVLSCTEGPMGTYPIFIFSPLPLAHISAPFLSSHMERLVQVLYKVLGQQPQRVYSVFSPKPVAHEFKRLWSETTAVASYLEPYYAAKLSFCTRKSFVNRQLTGHPDLIHNPRPAVEADIPKVAPLCYGFAQESEPFVLSEADAEAEAQLLVRNGQLWVHEIQLPDGKSDIASIVAVTRESDSVAAITKVMTSTKWRQKGCAERLVRRVCKHLLASNDSVILFVAHDNPPANKVYRRVGFVGLDEVEVEVEGVDPWVEIGFDRDIVELGHW